MFASGLFFLILLALFGRQMEPDWTFNTQYSYGWIVLPCALYLGWLRWSDRPRPKAPHHFSFFSAWIPLLFLLAPLRLVQEANPDWRLISWILGLSTCALALLWAYAFGGRAWLRHFSFPCLFPLVAIPWPTWMEQDLIQLLTRIVTSITVEGLNLIGIPALQHGNLIELSATWIGVNEACSGVRSFQATLMVALFLGEMFRFNWRQRSLFLAAGLTLAIVGNIARAFFLSYVTAEGNASSLESWHDPAGFSILAGVFILLLIAAFVVDGRTGKKARKAAPPPGPARVHFFSWKIWAAAIAWLALTEIGTELWYRSHEKIASPVSTWNLQLPQTNSSLITDSLPGEAQAMLRYDEGYRAAWGDTNGGHWSAIFLRWKPGRNAAQLALSHAPEVCLSAAGLHFVRDLGPRQMTANGLVFDFRMLEFRGDKGPIYVFYLLWEDRRMSKDLAAPEDYSGRSRWEAVLAGRRHLGQRLLEVAIARAPNPVTAENWLRQELTHLVQVAPGS